MMTIELEEDGAFRPQETLSGKVIAGANPRGYELRLFWTTRGRGTEELEVVGRVALSGPGPEVPFQFKLPATPVSFSGSLVSVVWGLELVDEQGEAVVCREFVMSPTGSEIVLGKVETPAHQGRKRWWNRKDRS